LGGTATGATGPAPEDLRPDLDGTLRRRARHAYDAAGGALTPAVGCRQQLPEGGQTVPDVVELIGYAASVLIVLSLMMSSLLRLRIISLIGSATFSLYGLLIGSVPVLLTNAAIMVINAVYLVRMWRDRAGDAYFEVVEVDPGSRVLRRFVDFHLQDIRRFQPEFDGVRDDHLAWMVLRDAIPAGAVLASRVDEDTAHLDLDYVTEEHRDFKAGSVLFGESGALQRRGIERVATSPGTPAHQRYLRKMGFESADGRWLRDLRTR
jgi:hypothetical protein